MLRFVAVPLKPLHSRSLRRFFFENMSLMVAFYLYALWKARNEKLQYSSLSSIHSIHSSYLRGLKFCPYSPPNAQGRGLRDKSPLGGNVPWKPFMPSTLFVGGLFAVQHVYYLLLYIRMQRIPYRVKGIILQEFCSCSFSFPNQIFPLYLSRLAFSTTSIWIFRLVYNDAINLGKVICESIFTLEKFSIDGT